MTDQERAEQLYAAAALVDGVSATLDTDTKICECCGLNRHSNWTHTQFYNQLESSATKLRRIADSFAAEANRH